MKKQGFLLLPLYPSRCSGEEVGPPLRSYSRRESSGWHSCSAGLASMRKPYKASRGGPTPWIREDCPPGLGSSCGTQQGEMLVYVLRRGWHFLSHPGSARAYQSLYISALRTAFVCTLCLMKTIA
jgi:hypothetical protein